MKAQFILFPLLTLSLLFVAAPSPASHTNVQAPHEVGGFVLGSKISEYPDVVDTNFLKEIVVTDRYGFRKGILSYGTCKYTDTILKIRMKYEDSSKKFYKKLLKEFKKKYGEPDEWKGDSFGILHIWKWHFTDQDNNKISLSLQHNLRNPNENIGNMVKLSYPDRIVEEQKCFNQMCDELNKETGNQRRKLSTKPDWQHLIPR